MEPVADGITSGDAPIEGGSFTHTFDTAGEYFFWSDVHQTLRAKVTVLDCVTCEIVAGYFGADPATLALALMGRAAGDRSLAARRAYA